MGILGSLGNPVPLLLDIVILLGLTAPPAAEKQAAPAPVGASAGSLGVADELLKYKHLLDQGVLTEEEYEEKKRELLGL